MQTIDRVLDVIDSVLDGIASLAMLVIGTMMVLLLIISGWLVFGRYVLNATPTWVEQAALLMVAWIAFLGAAVGVRRKTHLAVDFIREAMPGWLRQTLLLFSILAMAFFGVMVASQGWDLYERTARRMIPLIGLSEGLRAVPICLGGVMITLFCLQDLIKFALQALTNRTER